MRVLQAICHSGNMVDQEINVNANEQGIPLGTKMGTGSPGDQTCISPGRRRRHVIAQNAPLLHVRRFFRGFGI